MIIFCLILFAELGPISKTLNSTAREKACETLLAQACRHAPTLLDYIPSYKGVLKREKKKEGEPSRARRASQRKGDQAASGIARKRKAASNAKGARKKRQPGVRLPKIRYTAEEWLTPLGDNEVFEPVLSRLNVPLKFVEPNADEMSRRGIPRLVILTKTTNPARN